jgi:mannose-6-phosphate isomerase-like protein (cupin superfamily)
MTEPQFVRPLPDGSDLLAGRVPRSPLTFQSDQLQILYRNTDEPWSDPDAHMHQSSDECFIVLRGSLLVEIENRQYQVGPREMCFFPRGVFHRLVEAFPPVEAFIIRAPSIDDKRYRTLESWEWPDFLD